MCRLAGYRSHWDLRLEDPAPLACRTTGRLWVSSAASEYQPSCACPLPATCMATYEQIFESRGRFSGKSYMNLISVKRNVLRTPVWLLPTHMRLHHVDARCNIVPQTNSVRARVYRFTHCCKLAKTYLCSLYLSYADNLSHFRKNKQCGLTKPLSPKFYHSPCCRLIRWSYQRTI